MTIPLAAYTEKAIMNSSGFFENFSALAGQSPLMALLVAVALGVLSTGLCPFTVPAGVGIVGYVGSQEGRMPGRKPARRSVWIALAFYLGVLLSFAALGVAAAYVGQLLFGRWGRLFTVISAGVALLAGLAMIFSPMIRRYIPKPKTSGFSMGGAFLFGVVYSLAVVSTSAGPLVLVLTGGAAIGRPVFGAVLSLAYAVGRGLPFVLLGAFGKPVVDWLARLGTWLRIAEVMIGVALVALGVYLIGPGAAQ